MTDEAPREIKRTFPKKRSAPFPADSSLPAMVGAVGPSASTGDFTELKQENHGRVSKEELGNWTGGGFGLKLMQEMGYKKGEGLGKKSDGIVHAIQARICPKGASLDAIKEKVASGKRMRVVDGKTPQRKMRKKDHRKHVRVFFSVVRSMEQKHDTRPFEWAEIKREYEKRYNVMFLNDLATSLAAVYGGVPTTDARSLVSTYLQGIFCLVGEQDNQDPPENPRVQCIKNLSLNEKEATKTPHGRISWEYEAIKRRKRKQELKRLERASKKLKKKIHNLVQPHQSEREFDEGDVDCDDDDDEPKIKKERTENDEGQRAKQEREDSLDEIRRKYSMQWKR